MKKHILLIDDDQDELHIFVEALKQVSIPYKCTWAKSGEQALEQLLYLKPDIIFLDLHMPGMGGLECLAAIKRLPGVQHIPVNLHSSVMTAELRGQGMRLGASACFEKSASISELADMLQELMTAETAPVI
jgi:CheY-like chemotaxis protein